MEKEKYLYYINNLIKHMFHDQTAIGYIAERVKAEYIPKEFELQKAVMFGIISLWKEQKTVTKMTVDVKSTPFYNGDYDELEGFLNFVSEEKPDISEDEAIDYIVEMYSREKVKKLATQLYNVAENPNANLGRVAELAESIHETVGFYLDDEETTIYDIIKSQPLVEFKDPEFKRLLRGILRANLTFIGADPGMGKTSLGINWTEDFLSSGYKVMWFPNDTDYNEVMQKLVSHRLRINSELLVEANYTPQNPYGRLRKEEYERVVAEIDWIHENYEKSGLLTIKDHTTNLAETTLQIRKHQPDIAIIDTIQGMDMPNDEPMASGIPIILRELKKCAKRNNCAILGLTWMEAGGKRPTISQMYASKDMRRKGAKIWMLYYYYSISKVKAFENMLELIDGKQRFSKTSATMFKFEPEYSIVSYPLNIEKAVRKQYESMTGLNSKK